MADCALETVEEMGWGDNQLLPVEGPASAAAAPSAARFKGHGAEGAKSKGGDLDHLDAATPLATPWLASSPLASAARGLGKVCWSETSFSPREVGIAILTRTPTPNPSPTLPSHLHPHHHVSPSPSPSPPPLIFTRTPPSSSPLNLHPHQAEIAILATAYAYRAGSEWTVHVVEARKAGLIDEHIAAIARGCAPAFAPGSKERAIYCNPKPKPKPKPKPNPNQERAIYAVATDLLEHKRVSSANYAAGVASLGETGMVEIVSIVGYYGYVALTLNTFEIEDPHAPDVCVGEGGRSCAKSPWEADAALVG